RQGLGNYFLFYNMERLHQSLGYRTPSIEIFFKILKQNLRVKTFVGTSANALKIQIWTSLIAILLLKYLKVRSQYNWSLSNLVALLRLNLFTYRDLWEWIDRPTEPPPLLQEAEQLALSFV
ncbi:MAG: hypothetical protein PHQ48_08780, partial [Acidobacteriota bacterium]|nr:hypothetical protein [Acidobacteriota bacterium]